MDNLKPWYQRSSFWSAVIGTASLLLALKNHAWRQIPDEMVLSTLALWANFFGFQRASPSRSRGAPPPPPSVPLFLGVIAMVLSTVAFSAACHTSRPPPLPPGPTPIPTPVPPGPTPVPAGHVVTAVEYDAIVMGTPEATVLERFGAPWRRSAVGLPGTSAIMYPAKGPAGEDLVAEFWIRDGKVVTKNRL